MTDIITTGSSEPIECMALDSAGALLTGLVNLKVRIRRESDGKVLDWADMTFKAAAAVGTPLHVLLEVDAVHCPGEYRAVLVTSSITNPNVNDTYIATVIQDGLPQNAVNMPQQGAVTVGAMADNALIARAARTNRDELAAGAVGNYKLYADDDVTVLLTQDVTDPSGAAVTIPAGAPARRSRAV